jgi:branched-chain amino acid transport system ATP-binding protein
MLQVKGLQVHYGAVKAVNGIDLEVQQGELVALLGANGAGKSSTLLTIAGALQAAQGGVYFEGKEITALTPERTLRAGIAMVPETRDVFPDLTVLENLRLGAFIHRRGGEDYADMLKRMYHLFPVLEERIAQAAGTLSGGEQQQLVIARALMARPRLLLLDEPSLGLAPTIVERIFDHIQTLKASGLTILLVEQNANKALSCADRAYVMSSGRIVASGSGQEIAAGSDLASIYLGG